MYEPPPSSHASGTSQPPFEPGYAPPIVPPGLASAAGDPITERIAWTPSSNESPVYAPAPVMSASATAVPVPPATPPASRSSDAQRRSVGPGFVLGAVLASALLASGGTYLAVQAADGSHTIPTSASTVNPAAAASTPAPAGTTAPAGGTNAPAGGQASVVDIVKNVSPAVVTIVADGVTATDPTTGQTGLGTATGSGIIFDANGLILTNHHVVEGNPSKLTVNLKDGRSFTGKIYGIDTLTDLAIVKVDATGLPTAPIGDSSSIEVGQQAIAIGSPLGTFTDSVTSGIISAVGRDIPVENGVLNNLIQTDTAINPGNSGGPLLDPSGKVIGINTAVAGGSQGIGFAIPINIARPLLAQASAGQPLARPWLGIVFETIDPTIKQANDLPVDNGAWIPTATAASGQGSSGQDPNAQGGQGTDPFGQGTDPFGQGGTGGTATQPSVVADSPAARAGLQAGDIITSVDGTTLDASHPLDLVMSGYGPGQTVSLGVLRDGQTITVSVTLGTRPATA